MSRWQSGPQEAPGVLQGVPACGITVGQPAAGVAQNHRGGSIDWQMGTSEPNLQSLHQQRVPSPYQQASVASEQVLFGFGDGIGQAAGNGGSAQLACSTCHAPALQAAVVRHCGRGSSP